MASAQAPTNRPVWLIVLALAMLLVGTLTLLEGLLVIRDPQVLARLTPRDVAMTPSQEEADRRTIAINDAIIARHRTALRFDAGFSIAFGMWTLYATAAVLSRDRNGRVLALATAALGTAHCLAVLPFALAVAREAADATRPLLTEVSRRQIISTAVSVGWWLLVFFYFAGRRGRELYGLPPR